MSPEKKPKSRRERERNARFSGRHWHVMSFGAAAMIVVISAAVLFLRLSLDGESPDRLEEGSHALLFPSGTRFETLSSDELAIHGPITIEFWIKLVKPSDGTVELKLNRFKFWIRDRSLRFLVMSAHTLTIKDLGVGTWRHVAGTFDGSKMHLYLDGVEVTNGRARLAGNSLGVKASITIQPAVGAGPAVVIDELRVWNYARTVEQIDADRKNPPPVADEGLVAAFEFNEGSGQSVKDSGGRYHGWLGNDPTRADSAEPHWVADTPRTPGSNDALIEQAVNRDAAQFPPCQIGNCSLAFTGHDRVSTAKVRSLGLQEGLTLEAWMRLEKLPPHVLEIVKLHVGSVSYSLYLSMNRLAFVTAGGRGLSAPKLDLQSAWHHVAGTFDGSTQALYLDGVLVASKEVNFDASYLIGKHPQGQVTIGRAQQAGALVLIDEVRIWTMARSADEIRETMNAELSGDEPGLVGYWTFNETSGQIARDGSLFEQHAWLGQSPTQDDEDPSRVQEAPQLNPIRTSP